MKCRICGLDAKSGSLGGANICQPCDVNGPEERFGTELKKRYEKIKDTKWKQSNNKKKCIETFKHCNDCSYWNRANKAIKVLDEVGIKNITAIKDVVRFLGELVEFKCDGHLEAQKLLIMLKKG